MTRKQLEYLVMYQDLHLLLAESQEETIKDMGFDLNGVEEIEEAIKQLEEKINPQVLRTFKRLANRYHRPIAPVRGNVCLGCFTKLPTSFQSRAWSDSIIYTCENCGRILYWIEY